MVAAVVDTASELAGLVEQLRTALVDEVIRFQWTHNCATLPQ